MGVRCEGCFDYGCSRFKRCLRHFPITGLDIVDMPVGSTSEPEIHLNDQGGKQSLVKARYDLIDPNAIATLARIMYEGAQKYDDNNWRKIPTNDHINHAVAHIYKHLEGDTTEEHLAHAFTRLMMAVAKEME